METHNKNRSFVTKNAANTAGNHSAAVSMENPTILSEILAKLNADRFHVEIDWTKGNMSVKR